VSDISPQKNPDFSGSRDHGASGHSAGFHVQDPAVSDVYCGTERWSRVCVGSLPSCLGPLTGGLRKSGGGGRPSRRLSCPSAV